jgi:hypothetical protein
MRLTRHRHAPQEALKLALVVLAYRIFGRVPRGLAPPQEKLKRDLVVLAYRIFGRVLRRLAQPLGVKRIRPGLQLRVAKCAGEGRHVEIPVSLGMTSVTRRAAAPAMVEGSDWGPQRRG